MSDDKNGYAVLSGLSTQDQKGARGKSQPLCEHLHPLRMISQPLWGLRKVPRGLLRPLCVQPSLMWAAAASMWDTVASLWDDASSVWDNAASLWAVTLYMGIYASYMQAAASSLREFISVMRAIPASI